MVKLVSRIIYLDCKSTCIRLCDQEWDALDKICKEENVKRKELIEQIRINKNNQLGLTPAIRLFTLLYYKDHFRPQKKTSQTQIEALLSNIR